MGQRNAEGQPTAPRQYQEDAWREAHESCFANEGAVIKIKPSHRGLLHKKLGVPAGKKIPLSKLAKARHSSSPAMRKEVVFAENAKKWKHE